MSKKALLIYFLSICVVKWVLSRNTNEGLFSLPSAAFGRIEELGLRNNDVTSDKIRFYFFTKENLEYPEEMDRSKKGKIGVKIVFLIHGWLENKNVEWYESLKKVLLNNKNYFVVQVDWSDYSSFNYIISSYDTKAVGKVVGLYIADLNRKYSINLSDVMIVGHSLGAQIAGYSGKEIRNLTGQNLSRIIALDPAGPLFANRSKEKRLSSNDADVVQVIHTNGGTFGFRSACGTIDFFPNGGRLQPGCNTFDLLDMKSVAGTVYCSHQRSWKYFVNALLNPEGFMGTKCDSWSDYKNGSCKSGELVSMGDLKTKKTGKFYLATKGEAP